jgi:isopenicillin-N epimerase
MSARTRLLFFSHVLSPTGLVLPARALCAAARQRGVLTVIDGAHSPGMIPLEVDALSCDFYCGNCHKWLLAPTGSGFLYLGTGNEDRLSPLQVSWGWHHEGLPPDQPDEFGSTPRLRALEFEGIRDLCPWLTVPAAIDFQVGLGLERMRARIDELVRHVRQRFDGWRGLTLATPPHPQLHGAMTAFRLPSDTDIVALRRDLWDRHRIEIPMVERAEGHLPRVSKPSGPGAFLDWTKIMRVSTHFYNTEEEIDHLAEALKERLPE